MQVIDNKDIALSISFQWCICSGHNYSLLYLVLSLIKGLIKVHWKWMLFIWEIHYCIWSMSESCADVLSWNFCNQFILHLNSQEPEKTLDIFNITLARQQAEVEVSFLSHIWQFSSIINILLILTVYHHKWNFLFSCSFYSTVLWKHICLLPVYLFVDMALIVVCWSPKALKMAL